MALWLFDTDGLCAGGYHFMTPWVSYFEEINIFIKVVYGESGFTLSRDEGAVAS